VIVSDDGHDEATRDIAGQIGATYTQGPQAGLAANRNHALQYVQTPLVAFVDDDVIVSTDYIQAATSLDTDAITTGQVLNFMDSGVGELVTPHNADFWGFQRLDPDGDLRSIVVVATVFPTSVFDKIRFDERLWYGAEEIDIAQRATSRGIQIRFDARLWVEHHSYTAGREAYKASAIASRIYQNTKRHAIYDGNATKAVAFAILGPVQVVASAARRRRFREAAVGVKASARGISWALTLLNPRSRAALR